MSDDRTVIRVGDVRAMIAPMGEVWQVVLAISRELDATRSFPDRDSAEAWARAVCFEAAQASEAAPW